MGKIKDKLIREQEEDWGDLGAMPDVPDVEIEYQEDDGNSDCGDSCTI